MSKKTKLQKFVLALGIVVSVAALAALVMSLVFAFTAPANGYIGRFSPAEGDKPLLAYARFCNAIRKALFGGVDTYTPDTAASVSFVFGLVCCMIGVAWLVVANIKKKFIHNLYFIASIAVGFVVSFGYFLGTKCEAYHWDYVNESALALLIHLAAYVLFIAYIAFFVLNLLSLIKTPKKEKKAKAEEPKKEEAKPAPAPKAEEPKKEEVKAEEKPAEPVKKEEPKKEEPKPEPKKEEAKPVEKKPEPKKEEAKPAEKKPEPKPAEKKPEPKKEQPKPAPAPVKKAEPKKEEPKKAPAKKAEPKPAEKKPEPKKEEPKPAPAPVKKEEPKPAAKPAADKATPRAGAPKSYHITQHPNGGWQVKGSKSEKALKLFPTQAEAIAYARELEKSSGVSFRVHGRSGKIRKA